MNSKKILITGGLGYIGSHTALVFAQAGYEPILLDNLSNAYKDQVQNWFISLLGHELPLYEWDAQKYLWRTGISWSDPFCSKKGSRRELSWSVPLLWKQYPLNDQSPWGNE